MQKLEKTINEKYLFENNTGKGESVMPIEIDENNLKKGLLGLVIGLVEIIRDVLKHQAVARVDRGTLTDEECSRLGEAFIDLDEAIEKIKKEQDISEAVQSIRQGLDDLIDQVVDRTVNPQRWEEENAASIIKPGEQIA